MNNIIDNNNRIAGIWSVRRRLWGLIQLPIWKRLVSEDWNWWELIWFPPPPPPLLALLVSTYLFRCIYLLSVPHSVLFLSLSYSSSTCGVVRGSCLFPRVRGSFPDKLLLPSSSLIHIFVLLLYIYRNLFYPIRTLRTIYSPIFSTIAQRSRESLALGRISDTYFFLHHQFCSFLRPFSISLLISYEIGVIHWKRRFL